MLTDALHRKIDYLRLSVTENCNIRCHYCLPAEGLSRWKAADLMNFDEIERLVRILAGLGIRRVRITGGEPLIRKGLPRLIARLKDVPELDEVLLTTNGVLLKDHAWALREAGLEKINIHLDTLNAGRFHALTRIGCLEEVLDGIEAARKAGFSPIKINAVLQKGVNDGEAVDMVRFAAEGGFILRFIEMMPIGPGRGLMSSHFISAGEIRERLSETYTLVPSTERPGSGPAVYYRIPELGIPVGFISAVSQPFCEGCNRIRISSDGRFQDCLAYDGNVSLRDLMRKHGADDEALARAVIDLLQGKHESHDGFAQLPSLRTPCMSGIGG